MLEALAKIRIWVYYVYDKKHMHMLLTSHLQSVPLTAWQVKTAHCAPLLEHWLLTHGVAFCITDKQEPQ